MTISGSAEWMVRLCEIQKEQEAVKSGTGKLGYRLGEMIASKANPLEIAGAKKAYEKACNEEKQLANAIASAEMKVASEKAKERMRANEKQLGAITRLQKKRKKSLEQAGEAFSTALVNLIEAEELGLKLHEASGGVRPVLEAINSRHGPIITWVLVRFIDAMPKGLENQAGAVLANLNKARAQMEGKTLADLQPNYAKMVKAFRD